MTLIVSQPARPKGIELREASNFSANIAHAAVRSLYFELISFPKPGLVSLIDNGSHRDMSGLMFFKSLFSLRRYFYEIAEAAKWSPSFKELQVIGSNAEKRMLLATGGVNTHRGAIFSVGLLAAAAARSKLDDQNITLGDRVRCEWGLSILGMSSNHRSHGSLVKSMFDFGGAREEAAEGFPHVFQIGLPALRYALDRRCDFQRAMIHSFFSILSHLNDTNLLYRGGMDGLYFAQGRAKEFMKQGGVLAPDWFTRAEIIHQEFKGLNLSPGGSADLLSATVFVYILENL
jgi:triphosphoribosyl-dephospho-CoA synthase